MKRIKLTKLSDDAFNGNHPNNINEGYTKEGYMLIEPTIGENFNLYYSKTEPFFHTSIVIKELNENNEFKTLYSTYKIEYLD